MSTGQPVRTPPVSTGKPVCTPPVPTGQSVYVPPVFLWSLVEAQTASHEVETVKDLLGGSLVEQSIELHQEVNSSFMIYRNILINA